MVRDEGGRRKIEVELPPRLAKQLKSEAKQRLSESNLGILNREDAINEIVVLCVDLSLPHIEDMSIGDYSRLMGETKEGA